MGIKALNSEGWRERVKGRQMKALNVNGEALNDDVETLKGVKGQ